MKKLLPLLTFILLTSTAFAQEAIIPLPVTPPPPNAISITAIPPRLEISALPGVTLQETIKIQNGSDQELAFSVIATDFIVNNNQGTPVAVDESVSGRWSLSSWLTTTPQKILLKPNETAAINLIVTIPDDAFPGGHYAMVTYQPVTEGLLGAPAKTASAITQKVGSLIYLNVIGDVTEAANLKQFQVDKPFKYYGPTELTAEIENLGDTHFNPTGNLTITNLLGKTVFSQELETKNIFPFASRTWTWQFPGKYHLGRYMAKLEASAGSTQIPVNGLIYFWIVPAKELGAVLITLMLILVLIKLRKKKPTPPTPPVEPMPSPEPENIA
ncbi:MAG: hypothetical protein U0946_04910 [Patescibacteria group bacterium]|nr:hypothetical protein [Patescibacteria group bacterium]